MFYAFFHKFDPGTMAVKYLFMNAGSVEKNFK